MPLAGLEPKIPVLKRAKTFYALDRAATVAGYSHIKQQEFHRTSLTYCYYIYNEIYCLFVR
jgi:hypothetical protein